MSTFDEHLARMIAYARQQVPTLTDYAPGSVIRSIYEAAALEMELIGHESTENTQAAIEAAAYQLFNFPQRPASAASGVLRFTTTDETSAAITIPAGQQARIPGTDRIYSTLAASTIGPGAAGLTIDVQAASVGAGARYNTPADTIVDLLPGIDKLAVTNPFAWTNGRDDETDDERRQRFAAYVRALNRATADALDAAAREGNVTTQGIVTERVMAVNVIDIAAGIARVTVANGSTSAASPALLDDVAARLATVKAAGVLVQVDAASITIQAVTAAVLVDTGMTLAMVRASVEAAITGVFARLDVGETLYIEQIRASIMRVPGIVDVTLSVPAANVDPDDSTHLVQGTITVTAV